MISNVNLTTAFIVKKSTNNRSKMLNIYKLHCLVIFIYKMILITNMILIYYALDRQIGLKMIKKKGKMLVLFEIIDKIFLEYSRFSHKSEMNKAVQFLKYY